MTFTRIITVFALLAISGCSSYETRIYEGEVVDERNTPIKDVAITLCYTGWDWDWNMAGGFPLVMGHPFCSDTVFTDDRGKYKVTFAGPPGTSILARHRHWVQTKTFLANGGRVVLVNKDIYNKRIANQEAEKEQVFRRRTPNESALDYYCRVVRKRSHKIELLYQGHRITIAQSLLADQGKVILGVIGSYDIVQALSDNLIVFEQTQDGLRSLFESFEVSPEKSQCGNNMHFIVSSGYRHLSSLENIESVEVEVGGQGMFTVGVWRPEKPRNP